MFDYSDMAPILEMRSKMYAYKDGVEICTCGHSAGSHASIRSLGREKQEFCKVGAVTCNCQQYTPAVRITNAKTFRYRTGGSGKDHPLALGMSSAVVKHHATVTPMDAFKCAVVDCASSDRLWPVMWDAKLNAPTGYDTGVTKIICETHLHENGFAHILPGEE